MDFSENPTSLYLIAGIVVIAVLVVRFVTGRFFPRGGFDLPYRQAELLSATEKKFFRALAEVFPGDRYCVFAKVRLADLFSVTGVEKREYWKHFGKISQKHLDFLVVDRKTLTPYCGIELDDSTHRQQKRIERDGFVNAIFEKTALPLYRFPAAGNYDPEMIRGKVGNSSLEIS